jgi:chemotaxis protein methyltransferase CheR
MIYFDDVLRERVHRLFYESLTRFGILALGMKETLKYTAFSNRYEAIDEGLRLYRRIG